MKISYFAILSNSWKLWSYSYHGVNYLYENCDKNDTLFKDVIKAVIELVESQKQYLHVNIFY